MCIKTIHESFSRAVTPGSQFFDMQFWPHFGLTTWHYWVVIEWVGSRFLRQRQSSLAEWVEGGRCYLRSWSQSTSFSSSSSSSSSSSRSWKKDWIPLELMSLFSKTSKNLFRKTINEVQHDNSMSPREVWGSDSDLNFLMMKLLLLLLVQLLLVVLHHLVVHLLHLVLREWRRRGGEEVADRVLLRLGPQGGDAIAPGIDEIIN